MQALIMSVRGAFRTAIVAAGITLTVASGAIAVSGPVLAGPYAQPYQHHGMGGHPRYGNYPRVGYRVMRPVGYRVVRPVVYRAVPYVVRRAVPVVRVGVPYYAARGCAAGFRYWAGFGCRPVGWVRAAAPYVAPGCAYGFRYWAGIGCRPLGWVRAVPRPVVYRPVYRPVVYRPVVRVGYPVVVRGVYRPYPVGMRPVSYGARYPAGPRWQNHRSGGGRSAY